MSSAEETHEKVDTCNNYSMLSVEDEGSSPGAMAKPEEEKYAFFEDTARASSALGLTAPSSPDKPYDYLPYTKQTSELPSLVEKDDTESFQPKELSPAICQDTNPPAENFKSELHQLLLKSIPVKRQRFPDSEAADWKAKYHKSEEEVASLKEENQVLQQENKHLKKTNQILEEDNQRLRGENNDQTGRSN